ncbi:hypothetical protein BDV18DRAFT_158229 [Aspergillus unguis]
MASQAQPTMFPTTDSTFDEDLNRLLSTPGLSNEVIDDFINSLPGMSLNDPVLSDEAIAEFMNSMPALYLEDPVPMDGLTQDPASAPTQQTPSPPIETIDLTDDGDDDDGTHTPNPQSQTMSPVSPLVTRAWVPATITSNQPRSTPAPGPVRRPSQGHAHARRPQHLSPYPERTRRPSRPGTEPMPMPMTIDLTAQSGSSNQTQHRQSFQRAHPRQASIPGPSRPRLDSDAARHLWESERRQTILMHELHMATQRLKRQITNEMVLADAQQRILRLVSDVRREREALARARERIRVLEGGNQRGGVR